MKHWKIIKKIMKKFYHQTIMMYVKHNMIDCYIKKIELNIKIYSIYCKEIYTQKQKMSDNNLQEYVQLIIAKRERDILEEMLEEGVNYNNQWIASNAEYTEMEDKLAALYAKISEIRKYLHNVSPSYREKFAENHEIDSVISVF